MCCVLPKTLNLKPSHTFWHLQDQAYDDPDYLQAIIDDMGKPSEAAISGGPQSFRYGPTIVNEKGFLDGDFSIYKYIINA